jgi:hypothetical protein
VPYLPTTVISAVQKIIVRVKDDASLADVPDQSGQIGACACDSSSRCRIVSRHTLSSRWSVELSAWRRRSVVLAPAVDARRCPTLRAVPGR